MYNPMFLPVHVGDYITIPKWKSIFINGEQVINSRKRRVKIKGIFRGNCISGYDLKTCPIQITWHGPGHRAVNLEDILPKRKRNAR
jgi:hypothetical protein